MSTPLTMIELAALSALVLGLVLLAVGALLGWRDANRRLAAETRDAADMVAGLGQRLEQALAAQDARRSDEHRRLSDDLSAMRAEVDWLAGERMIEQAAQMCRDGVPAARIGEDLGLSQDTVRTIALLRAH